MKLNQLDLNKLHTFLVVAEEGGMAKASEKLLLTRSALSQGVSSLEEALGVRLFNRVGKKLLLTPAGKELHHWLREYHRGLESKIQSLTSTPAETRGVVRVGLFIGFSKAKLTEFLSGFLNRFPGIQLKLLFVSQPELASLLLENKIDFAFSIYPLTEKGKAISSAKLFDEELVLVSGRKYYLPNPGLKEVQALPVIDYYQNGQLVRTWVKHHFGKGVGQLNIRAYGAAIDFVLELVLQNAGVGIVPRYVAEPYLRRKRLFQISTGKPELTDSIWLNEVKGFSHTPAARTFLELLRSDIR